MSSNLDEFQKRLERIAKGIPEVCQEIANEMAGEVEKRTKRTTPFLTGRLKRAWRIRKNPKLGNTYSTDVVNNVEYAPYVEYGHRTANHRGFVPGFFMMTRALDEVDQFKAGIMAKKFREFVLKQGW